MRIAICDDEINEANNIRFALMDIENRLEIDIFEKGHEFLDSIKGGRQYDLVFMDVYMGEENGNCQSYADYIPRYPGHIQHCQHRSCCRGF